MKNERKTAILAIKKAVLDAKTCLEIAYNEVRLRRPAEGAALLGMVSVAREGVAFILTTLDVLEGELE